MVAQILSLRQAIPYLAKYRGKRFVIKVGGSLLERESDLKRLSEGITALYHLGIKVVLVHGGGPQLDRWAKELQIEQAKVAGRRITSLRTLELAKMVFAGTTNTDLVAAFGALGAPAVGLTGIDAFTVVASKRPPVEIQESPDQPSQTVDFGYVGDIQDVRPKLIEELLSQDYIPIICSLAADRSGQVLNVNADTVAQHLAVKLQAEKYINVTNTPGLLKDANDPQSLLSYADIEMVESMKRDRIISGGMLPKADSCIAALRGGVKRAHIISGLESDSLLKEVFTNEGCGTLIVERIEKNGH